MDTWRAQREIRRNPKKYKQLEIAFSTFFLNRTNRSGILKAGVIGGNDQSGKWKIDARYNKENLIQRIEKIGRFAECIHLYNEDAVVLTERLRKKLPKETLFYFDPPYYNKGKELYINFYEHEDHVHIAKAVGKIKKQNWVVSYDNDSNIKCLYDKYLQQTYDLNYSAGKASVGSEVIMFSNKLIVPKVKNPAEKKELMYFDTHGLFAEWHEIRG
jgi:DNA adenine methylase